MKQTAVDWLIDQLEKHELYSKISFQCLREIDQAKAMEKEQIMDAYEVSHISMMTAEQYYNETLNTNEK